MSNGYFNHTSTLSALNTARAAVVNAVFEAVASGFDLLPDKDKLNQARVTYAADTGAADAYVITLDPVPTSYVDGLEVSVKISASNTGPCTLNVNGLGARSIKLGNGSNPTGGDLTAGDVHRLVFDGTNFRIQSPTKIALNAVAQGVGAVGAIDSPTVTDLNDTDQVNGFHRVESSTLNRPSGVTFGVLQVVRYNAAAFAQILHINPGTTMMRYYSSPSFGDWKTFVDDSQVTPQVSVMISDDAVEDITPPQTAGFMQIVRGGGGNTASLPHSAAIWYDTGTSPQVVRDSATAGSSLTFLTDGTVLTGSTGVDGVITLSAGAGIIQIENRIGFEVDYEITWGGN